MEQRLTLITLGVSNVKTSKTFYESVFGWTPGESSNDDIIFYKLNGIMLALFKDTALAEDAAVSPEGSGFRRFTLAHNARSVEEVDHLVNTLSMKGAKVIKPPHKVFWGGYSGYVADPDGHLWEIAFNPFMPLDDLGNVV